MLCGGLLCYISFGYNEPNKLTNVIKNMFEIGKEIEGIKGEDADWILDSSENELESLDHLSVH